MRRTIALAALFLLSPVVAIGTPTAIIVDDPEHLGCPMEYTPSFPQDNVKLVVKDGTSVLAELPFCSSYAEANVAIEEDAHGAFFVLLSYGMGRGTKARSDYLAVFKLNRHLIEYVRIPISAPDGGHDVWVYRYTIYKPPTGGLVLNLTLDKDPDAKWFPAEGERTIEVR